ncbi:MAG: phenylacetic acid degradation operon negative regulatory protein PaaX [Rhodocyclales bacterium RIFCSPLOWO2_02_FULL_63_24]|nr:MAG: phenylacetic acid degradation operon negative regulatory protein PaaX [Rhodocyclales bacterium RIFCSPLOWO2_02_FULL_63_24]
MKSRFIRQWMDEFLAGHTLRSNSLIITIYGDAIAPHGGAVWLGSFIKLVEPLGLNPRVVRTSVFRLSKEKWLVSEQIGRRSYYSLTATGRRRFEHAYRRIYDDPRQHWDGDWQVVFTGGGILPQMQRDALRRELLWEGFGVIAPGVLAHPAANHESLLDILQDTGAHDKVVVIQGRTLGALASRPLQELVRECWNLDHVAADYKRFSDCFRPVARAIKAARELDPEQAFCVRTLLIHEFRRVQLRDPQLPRQLLPNDWPGDIARQICAELYLLTRQQAERHLTNILETANGPLPEAAPYFQLRFEHPPVNDPTENRT